MEEQKSKEAKMNNTTEELNQEYTQEQLIDACNSFAEENEHLKHRLNQAIKYINTVNRLDYLLRIVEIANGKGNYSFDPDFTNDCIMEIQELITLPKKEQEADKEG